MSEEAPPKIKTRINYRIAECVMTCNHSPHYLILGESEMKELIQ